MRTSTWLALAMLLALVPQTLLASSPIVLFARDGGTVGWLADEGDGGTTMRFVDGGSVSVPSGQPDSCSADAGRLLALLRTRRCKLDSDCRIIRPALAIDALHCCYAVNVNVTPALDPVLDELEAECGGTVNAICSQPCQRVVCTSGECRLR